MTISLTGYNCAELYGSECMPELQAVRMGSANYECKLCGTLTFGPWPADQSESQEEQP